ncbi:hypothetical protein [Kitasatospora sp. NPDC088134]|uniref:hypothetical protein n=1 Tax=Kitasatospora sp. NPDC088134 TaxID=3364071 RepID=UPI0038015AFE
MALRFIGIDPETQQQGSPTVWVDAENKELVFQGWKASAALKEECAQKTAPGHATEIPDHEDVVRFPARMIPILREACDAAEQAGLL